MTRKGLSASKPDPKDPNYNRNRYSYLRHSVLKAITPARVSKRPEALVHRDHVHRQPWDNRHHVIDRPTGYDQGAGAAQMWWASGGIGGPGGLAVGMAGFVPKQRFILTLKDELPERCDAVAQSAGEFEFSPLEVSDLPTSKPGPAINEPCQPPNTEAPFTGPQKQSHAISSMMARNEDYFETEIPSDAPKDSTAPEDDGTFSLDELATMRNSMKEVFESDPQDALSDRVASPPKAAEAMPSEKSSTPTPVAGSFMKLCPVWGTPIQEHTPVSSPKHGASKGVPTTSVKGLSTTSAEELDTQASTRPSTSGTQGESTLEGCTPSTQDDANLQGVTNKQRLFLARREMVSKTQDGFKKAATVPAGSGKGQQNNESSEPPESGKTPVGQFFGIGGIVKAKIKGKRQRQRRWKPLEELIADDLLVPFAEEEKKILFAFFELHDDDSSNSLSLSELKRVVDDIGRKPPEGSEDAHNFEQLMSKEDEDGSGELNFEEFATFLAKYYQSVYARLFVENDVDKSGAITKFELKGVIIKLKDSGFKIRGDDIADLFTDMDKRGDGVLDWREFCDFMSGYRKLEFDLLKESAGFTGSELDFLLNVFRRADADSSGQLSIKEMVALLERSMLSSLVETSDEIQKIARLFTRMDRDGSMTLDFMEFLRLLRVWWMDHARDGNQVLGILEAFQDSSRYKAKRETSRAVTAASISGVDEGNSSKIAELQAIAYQNSVEDGILSAQNNLAIEEVQILRESFEFCDADLSGSIDRDELSIILKNLGCAPITLQTKAAFSKTVGREEFCGALDFALLVRFLVVYQEACAKEVMQGLADEIPHSLVAGDLGLLKAAERKQEPGIPTDKLVQALYQLGQYLGKDDAMALLGKVGGDQNAKTINTNTFLKMLEVRRSKALLSWRQTCGFSQSQFLVIKHAFSQHSAGEDDVMNRDGAVLEALQLLNLAPPPEKQDQLMRALLRVDRRGEGTLTFHDFLLLVRHLENHKSYARKLEEESKAQLAGLDADALQQFRQVFNDCQPSFSGHVEYDKINKLLSTLGVVRTPAQRRQLKKIIDEVDDDDVEGLEFSQFVHVLHELEKQAI